MNKKQSKKSSSVSPVTRKTDLPEEANLPQEIEIEPAVLTAMEAMYQRIHSGPIPPPDHCEHYEKLLPGAFNRILIMAEKQQTSDNQDRRIYRFIEIAGMLFGVSVLAGLAGLGAYIAISHSDNPVMITFAGVFMAPAILSALQKIITRR